MDTHPEAHGGYAVSSQTLIVRQHAGITSRQRIILVCSPCISCNNQVLVRVRVARRSKKTGLNLEPSGHFHASPGSRSYSRDSMGSAMELSSCFVICHRCNHAWVYFGSRLASLQRARKPVTVQCPRCHNRVKMDARNAL